MFWVNGYTQGVSRGLSLEVPIGDHTVTCRIEEGPVQVRVVRVLGGDSVGVGFRFWPE